MIVKVTIGYNPRWRTVTIPHDFVVEGNFSKTFDEGDAALGTSVDAKTGERMGKASHRRLSH